MGKTDTETARRLLAWFTLTHGDKMHKEGLLRIVLVPTGRVRCSQMLDLLNQLGFILKRNKGDALVGMGKGQQSLFSQPPAVTQRPLMEPRTAQSMGGKSLSWSRPSESQRNTQVEREGARHRAKLCFLCLGV